jgi:hypothetical protein
MQEAPNERYAFRHLLPADFRGLIQSVKDSGVKF